MFDPITDSFLELANTYATASRFLFQENLQSASNLLHGQTKTVQKLWKQRKEEEAVGALQNNLWEWQYAFMSSGQLIDSYNQGKQSVIVNMVAV